MTPKKKHTGLRQLAKLSRNILLPCELRNCSANHICIESSKKCPFGDELFTKSLCIRHVPEACDECVDELQICVKMNRQFTCRDTQDTPDIEIQDELPCGLPNKGDRDDTKTHKGKHEKSKEDEDEEEEEETSGNEENEDDEEKEEGERGKERSNSRLELEFLVVNS